MSLLEALIKGVGEILTAVLKGVLSGAAEAVSPNLHKTYKVEYPEFDNKCPLCGAYMTLEDRYCPECYYDLEESGYEYEDDEEDFEFENEEPYMCPNCHTEMYYLGDGVNECPKCGFERILSDMED